MSNQVARNSKSNYVAKRSNIYDFAAVQAIPTASATVVEFDQLVGTDTINSLTTTVPGIYVTGEAGLYLVACSVLFAANGTGYREIYLEINASAYGTQLVQPDAAAPTALSTCFPIYLAENSTIKVVCRQTSGGNLDVDPLSRMSIVFIK